MCGTSHVLPQSEAYSERAEGGTDNHALVGGYVNGAIGAADRLEKAVPGLIGKLAEHGGLMSVSGLVAEAAYVVDVEKRTSTFLGHDIGRAYVAKLGREMTDYELGVSLDLQAVKDGSLWVRDLKFGIYHSWWQLYVQSMAVLWLPGETRHEVDAGFLFVETHGEEPYVNDDARVLYAMDLDDRAVEIMEAFDRARLYDDMIATGPEDGGMPYTELKTVSGKWCQYCGGFPHCPQKWQLAKSMLSLDVVGSVGALTLEQCGAAWKKLAEIEKNIIKVTKDALKERMGTEGGFPLESGKTLRLVQMPGRASLDRAATVALLQSKGATSEEIGSLFKQGLGYDQVRECK